jgi:hypothetical protein
VIRRLILLLVILLNSSVVAAYSADNVATTTITGDNQRIGVEIPTDLEPGYHSVAVESTDPVTGEVSVENLSFCKDLEGGIHWEGSCGVITPLAPQKVLEATKMRTELPAFDPISQPKKSLEVQVAAFAALTVLAVGGATGGFSGLTSTNTGSLSDERFRLYARREELDEPASSSTEEDEKDKEKQDLETIESEQLKRLERKEGRGDLAGTWKLPMTPLLDSVFIASAFRTSRVSPVLSRIFYDGNYLRAMIGSLAAVLHPIGLILGVIALNHVGAQALPPSWILFSLIIVLGVIDSFAGFLTASIFFLGVLVNGNLSSRDELLTVVGTIAVFFAPALIASAFRPFRREIRSSADKWERLTDYLLAAVLTGWTVSKMIGSLSGLASIQLPITFFAFKIGVVAAVAVAIRLAGEDCAIYLFPVRLAALQPELSHPSKIQMSLAIAFKTAVFAFLAEPFIGNSIQLWLGIFLFLLPKVVSITVAGRLPKSKLIHKVLPKGALKIVVMVFVGTIFARWVQSFFQDPTQFLRWGFVVLGLPGLVLQSVGFFADRSTQINWKYEGSGRFIYRLGGVVIFFFIVEIALGKNIADLLLGT